MVRFRPWPSFKTAALANCRKRGGGVESANSWLRHRIEKSHDYSGVGDAGVPPNRSACRAHAFVVRVFPVRLDAVRGSLVPFNERRVPLASLGSLARAAGGSHEISMRRP